jgi:AcrR family transcriptional regulator
VKRKYELKARAERQAQTRRRIVEAAVELHTTLGPGATSISAIAERAGVQRHTVYAHFPDEDTLFGTCSAHWASQNPFPDPATWQMEPDPERRAAAALAAIYAWYESVESGLAVLLPYVEATPERSQLLQARRAQLVIIVDGLMVGRRRRKVVRAALGHALAFETWRSLMRHEGLSRPQAVDAMVRFVASV